MPLPLDITNHDKMDKECKPWRDAVRKATLEACEGTNARATKIHPMLMGVVMAKEDFPGMPTPDAIGQYVQDFVPAESVVLWEEVQECPCLTHEHWHVLIAHAEYAAFLNAK